MHYDDRIKLKATDFIGPRIRDFRSFRNGTSLSGNERNHLFLNNQGRSFSDVSGVSGIDDPGDGRVFAILDYDRDGWPDLAVVNANSPLLLLYRNLLGDRPQNAGRGQVLALRFVGGNHSDQASSSWSNRDGYGAMVTIQAGDLTIRREHRCGEGFAAQNSATMLVGIGDQSQADTVTVRWPSGKVQQTSHVPAGTLLTVFEDRSHSPRGDSFVVEPYKAAPPNPPLGPPLAHSGTQPQLMLGTPTSAGIKLRLYTTMATWCTACKRELAQVEQLRSAFSPDSLALFGVPVDPDDRMEKLDGFLVQYHPAYELLTDLTADQRSSVGQVVMDTLKGEGLPATIVTDGGGHVLRTTWGVPSISEVRQLLREAGQTQL